MLMILIMVACQQQISIQHSSRCQSVQWLEVFWLFFVLSPYPSTATVNKRAGAITVLVAEATDRDPAPVCE